MQLNCYSLLQIQTNMFMGIIRKREKIDKASWGVYVHVHVHVHREECSSSLSFCLAAFITSWKSLQDTPLFNDKNVVFHVHESETAYVAFSITTRIRQAKCTPKCQIPLPRRQAYAVQQVKITCKTVKHPFHSKKQK